MKSGTETDLTRAILAYLDAIGVYAWRQNSGAVSAFYKGKRRFVRFTSRNGISDIVGIMPGGRLLAIECKVGKNRTTAHQEAFIDAINSHGGLAFVARSVSDVVDRLRSDGGAGDPE